MSFFQASLPDPSSANGFWSIIDDALPGVSEGIGKVTSDIFPRYVSNQLLDQQTNQLDRQLFNAALAQPRVEDVANFQAASSGSLNMKEIAILGGVALVGLFIALKV